MAAGLRASLLILSASLSACGPLVINDDAGPDAALFPDAQTDASIPDAAPANFDLTLTITGEGEGRVRSSTAELDCTATCTQTYEANTTLTLDALPQRSSTFAGWLGTPCTGRSTTCTVTMDQARSITARFDAPGGLARFTKIEDLGALPTGTTSWAWAINDAGAVTGFADTAQGQRGFRVNAESTTMIALDPLGGDFGSAWKINETGWVAGESYDEVGYRRACLTPPHPSIEPMDLGTLGGNESHAYGLNASNWTVGRSENGMLIRKAFRRPPSGPMEELGTLGGMQSTAGDINDDGWMVGSADTSDGYVHAFRIAPYPATELEDLLTLGGLNSGARAINSSGMIIGGSDIPGDAGHAFRIDPWPATAMIDLGTLGGTNSNAYGLNDAGQIVGSSADRAGIARAFIWDPSSELMVDLNELLPRDAVGWELRYATDINNRGVITGMAVHNGTMRAYRLSP